MWSYSKDDYLPAANNINCIYSEARDIEQWKKDLWRFDPSKFKWTWFDEPDLGNRTTAIAIYEKDFPGFIRKKLKQEKLLTGLQ